MRDQFQVINYGNSPPQSGVNPVSEEVPGAHGCSVPVKNYLPYLSGKNKKKKKVLYKLK